MALAPESSFLMSMITWISSFGASHPSDGSNGGGLLLAPNRLPSGNFRNQTIRGLNGWRSAAMFFPSTMISKPGSDQTSLHLKRREIQPPDPPPGPCDTASSRRKQTNAIKGNKTATMTRVLAGTARSDAAPNAIPK
jgi:hypothetical protein